MALNYAEVWSPDLLEIMEQESLTSPFITTAVKWLNAKTFHFTQMNTSGYKSHNRNGGWNRGTYAQEDVPFTLTHDRDIEFLVDVADVDETNKTASIKNISKTFHKTQQVPEMDAYFFSKVATEALKLEKYHSETAESTWTKENVFGKLKSMLSAGKLRRYVKNGSLICYVRSFIMDLLEQSTDFTRKIEMTQIAEGGIGIETRVTDIDGVTLMEVIDDERFYDKFDFTDGFLPVAKVETTYKASTDSSVVPGKTYYTESGGQYTVVAEPTGNPSSSSYYEVDKEGTTGSRRINVLIASLLTVKTVPKIANIYYFEPGGHTEGDGYLYQDHSLSDTFVFPNGKDNKIDSIYVDVDTTEYDGEEE